MVLSWAYTPLWQIYVITKIKISQVKTCVYVIDVIIGNGHAVLYRYVEAFVTEAVHVMIVWMRILDRFRRTPR